MCTGGWCWELPWPVGSNLNDVAASSCSDVWVAGDFGVLLHFDGLAWSQYPMPASARLSCAAAQSQSVALLGGTTSFAWDGARWVSAGSTSFTRLASAGTVTFGVSASPIVSQWTGTWGTFLDDSPHLPQPFFTSVAANSGNDVWVVGPTSSASGLVKHKQGMWSDLDGPWMDGGYMPWSVASMGPNDAYVAADLGYSIPTSGTLFHLDAGAWEAIDQYSLPVTLRGLHAAFGRVVGVSTSSNRIYDYSVQAQAGSWYPITGSSSSSYASAAILCSNNDGWAVGLEGLLARWQAGSGWSAVGTHSIVYGFAESDLGQFAATASGILARDAGQWTVAAAATNLNSIAPDFRDGGFWVTDWSRLYEWNGAALVEQDAGLSGVVRSVSASAPDVGWVVGSTVRRWDGSAWVPVDAGVGVGLMQVVSVARDEAWATGNSKLFRWDGGSWAAVDAGPAGSGIAFSSVAANGAGVWAGGWGGLVESGDGGWRRVQTRGGVDVNVTDVTASSGGVLVLSAFSDPPGVYRYDAGALELISTVPANAGNLWIIDVLDGSVLLGGNVGVLRLQTP